MIKETGQHSRGHEGKRSRRLHAAYRISLHRWRRLISTIAPPQTWAIALIAVAWSICAFAEVNANASQQIDVAAWSQVEELWTDSGFVTELSLAADKYGQLHALWIQNAPETRGEEAPPAAVYYTRRDLDGYWSPPVDVLVSPSGTGISRLAVVVDSLDRVHVFFVDTSLLVLYHTFAPVGDADNTRSWIEPEPLARNVYNVEASSNTDEIVVATIQLANPVGVFAMVSKDFGERWDFESRVFSSEPNGGIPSSLSVDSDSDGRIQIVWSMVNADTFDGEEILYAASQDQGNTWSVPRRLVAGPYGSPTVFSGRDRELHVAYNGTAGTDGRYHIVSLDAGNSWGPVRQIAPGVGGLTGGSLAQDSDGMLHYVTAAHLGTLNDVAYANWDGEHWSEPDGLLGSTDTARSERRAFEPQLVIVGGNEAHVVLIGEQHRQVLYVEGRLSSSDTLLPPIPPQSSDVEPDSVPPEGTVPAATTQRQDPERPQARFSDPSPAGPDMWSTILVPVLLVVALIVSIMLFRHRFTR